MKKIISMGIASAVLALTAIAASADIKADTADKAVSGKTIKVEITTTAEITDCGFIVSATGLEVESVDTTTVGSTIVNKVKEDGTVKIGGMADAGKTIKAGTVLATITYTVTGATGDAIAVAIDTASQGYDDVPVNYTATVVAEETSDPTSSDPTSESGSESTSESGSESGSGEGGSDVPGTGVALAVVPAVLAGAAVVVAKKRK